MTLVFRALVGAAVVLLIALLARTRNYYIAGLLPLFPSLALIAHYIVGTDRGPEALRVTALFGLWSLIPYAVYLIAVYHLAGRFTLPVTLAVATALWLAAAAVLVTVWTRLHPAA